MLPLLITILAEVPPGQELPHTSEINGAGQVLLGLGLGGTMIAGFLIVIGVALIGFLFLEWSLSQRH